MATFGSEVVHMLTDPRGAESTPWNGDDGSCDNLHELHYERKATSGGVRDIMVEEMVSSPLQAHTPSVR